MLLIERLQEAVSRINSKISIEARENAINQIQRVTSRELIANNEASYKVQELVQVLDPFELSLRQWVRIVALEQVEVEKLQIKNLKPALP